MVLFVGLNPSTADATHDDPTLRRCVRFARDWGFGGLVLANLFALRSTDPAALRHAADPVGPDNDRHLRRLSRSADLTVAAWGTHGALFDRDLAVLPLLHNPHCLALTRCGRPKHPLYLPATLRPVAFRPRHAAMPTD